MLGLVRTLWKASTTRGRHVDILNQRIAALTGNVRLLDRGYAQSTSGGPCGASMRVGVLGAGRVAATVHMPNLVANRRLDLSWIVEDNPAAAQSVKSDLNITTPVHTSDQLPALIDDKSIEAVFVFTPVPTHYPLIKECLEKGKAVFSEKPMAETTTELEQLYDTAERVGRPLFAGFNRRFDPAFSDIYRALTDGELGNLRVAKITSRDSPRPDYTLLRNMDSSGCSIISEFGVHDFDFLTWIMRVEAPETVFAVAHAHDAVMAEMGEADVSSIMVKYQSGAIGMIDLSRESCYGYDARVELFGSLGMAASENPRENFAVWNSETGAQRRRMMHSFPQRFRESFIAEIDHFIDCVEGKATPLVTKEECIMGTLVKDAALESFRRKQAVDFRKFLTEMGVSITAR